MLIKRLPTPIFEPIGSGVERSEGVHMSDIRDRLGVALGAAGYDYLKRAKPLGRGFANIKTSKAGFGDSLDLSSEIGFMFEAAIEKELATRAMQGKNGEVTRPPEIVEDGVIMSPDGVEMKRRILHEFKFKFMAMPEVLDLESLGSPWWKVGFQLKCYLYALGMNTAHIWILFANGDYKKLRGPRFTHWEATWTDAELGKFWNNWVLPTKEEIDRENKSKIKGKKVKR